MLLEFWLGLGVGLVIFLFLVDPSSCWKVKSDHLQ